MPAGDVGDARSRMASHTVSSMMKHLTCDEPMQLLVADDGSPESRLDHIQHIMRCAEGYWEYGSLYTNSGHQGIGASLNLAMLKVTDLWLYNTDDWLLTDDLDLSGPISLLRNHGYDLVRLGPIHPDLRCTTRFSSSVGWWLDIDQFYGGFAFATRPFIATKEFYNKVGPFDECPGSYETERLYAERVAKSTSRLAYWGGVNLAGPWKHLGIDSVGEV